MYNSQFFKKVVLFILLVPLNYFLLLPTKAKVINNQTETGEKLEIPFKLERNKVILQVTIANSKPLKVILDTGMSIEGLLLYNKALKDSLDLKNAVDVKVPGAGKGKPSTAVMADDMSFNAGNVQFDNQRIVILQNDQFKGFPTDGVIGHSLLGNYGVEIDYEDEVIRLSNPEEIVVDISWQVLPISFRNTKKIPWIEASVNSTGSEEVDVDMYIDLASGEGIELLLRDEQKFTLPEGLEDAYLGRGLSGDIYGQKGFIHCITLGDYTLSNVSAAFAPAEVRSKQKGADGVIGNDLLRRFDVIFDYSNEKLYIKPSKYFSESF
jgi:hypothetical protein